MLGVGSAYYGCMIDLLFQRVMDVFMAFPLIIMALAIVSMSRSLHLPPDTSVYFVITNFFVDILYAWLDPRIRYS